MTDYKMYIPPSLDNLCDCSPKLLLYGVCSRGQLGSHLLFSTFVKLHSAKRVQIG